MLANSEYEFTLFVSQKNYSSKPSKDEMHKMRFVPQQLTIESALECATQGKAFCYTFQSDKADGSLSVKDKKKENFISTSAIIYDFDDMKVSMAVYINSIPYKPSFAYPTYSDGKNGLSRFRLAYVFDEEILGENDFNAVFHAIANANKFVPETKEQGGWDVRSVAQMYFGTTQDVSTYISNTVYSIDDFEPYMVPVTVNGTSTKVSPSNNLNRNRDIVDKEFLYNLYHSKYEDFFKSYFDSYYSNYSQSLETTLTLSQNEMWYEYPDDYVAVFRKREGKKVLKWNIGEDRKKRLYITAQMMLHNCPELTIENLIYNLYIERKHYYNNADNKINNQVLINTAVNAFNRRINLNPSNHSSYRVNKEFWSEQGVGVHQAKGFIRRERRVQEILPYIDSNKTIKENHQILIDNGIDISVRTLQRMVTRGDIYIYNNNVITLLSECRSDVTIRQKQIIELMKTNDKITADEIAKQLDCDVRTVKRDIKKMRGVLIDRVGNNRSGHWVVLSDEEPEQEPVDDYVMSDFDFLEESFEADKTIVDIPQPKSDDELREELLSDGWTEQEVADFFSIYQVA
ncbi:MAG: helix-turn-helix domain-containing protein [Alistipes sp.]|nr:helix-turn-helix domain-containing protein [Alistipes sp.]